jgi:hypothetical protein
MEQANREGHGNLAGSLILGGGLRKPQGGEEGMEPDDLLCSRNARPQKALVGRAQ